MNNNELMHYGVPGMKWGHRKNYYGSSGNKYRASNGVIVGAPKDSAVAAIRKIQGTKVGGAAVNGMAKVNTAFYGRGKNKATWQRLEKQVRKENEAVREANKVHKQAKTERKQKIKDTYKSLNKNASFGERLIYNNATRKKAAKYIVDNDMSVADATKKAKGDAWRNTAAMVAAYSAVTVAGLYKTTH